MIKQPKYLIEELILIAPAPAINKRTRLAKMPEVFCENGFTVLFLGWERIPGELNKLRWTKSGVTEKTILRGGGYVSKKTRLMYPLWMLAVFWNVLFLGRRRWIMCLGWETAFPAQLAAFFTGSQIIFDDADRFSMILKLPGPLHKFLQCLERWSSRKAYLHLVPGMSRYEWNSPNMIVLRNSPVKNDFKMAQQNALARPDADLVIYANGWLGHTRGAPIILAALQRLEKLDKRFRIILAGRVDCESGKTLIEHPLVNYYGEIPQVEALSLYLSSDVALTFYDPIVPINRKAEANKWGDCVYLGTPFIVNSEVETARKFVQKGAAFSFSYTDVDCLVSILEDLATHPEKLSLARESLVEFKTSYPLYDEQLRNICYTLLAKQK